VIRPAAARLTDLAYGMGWASVRRLPEPVAQALFRRIADRMWRRRVGGVRQLRTNLRRVVGNQLDDATLDELTHAAMRSYLRYWCEAFRLPSWSTDELIRRLVVHDEDILRSAAAAGNGLVAVLPHMGNWDHAGAWIAATGVPFTTVVERLRPEALYDRFVAYRESLGMEVVPLTGGDSPFLTLRRRLGEGRMICLLGDRDLTAAGVEVSFFGEPARMPAGPAALSLAAGSPLMPVSLWYEGPVMHLRMHPYVAPPADGSRSEKVAMMTQQVADVFAAAICAHPMDWHMLQRVWVSDLDPTRLPTPAARASTG
jgi:phosphatidylinositol dimannoside acyltransferase